MCSRKLPFMFPSVSPPRRSTFGWELPYGMALAMLPWARRVANIERMTFWGNILDLTEFDKSRLGGKSNWNTYQKWCTQNLD